RRVFALTEKGEEAYQKLLRENLKEYDPAIFTGDVGVAFLDDLEPSEARALLAERRKELVARLERASAAPRHNGSIQLLVEHQMRHLQSEISWLDEVLAKLTFALPSNAMASQEMRDEK
ncbi:MAG TPA: hypothetical protein PLJ62_10405, partial [Thermoflexales bacterium]|nr:hypothetical protein [Thermoflexales bacterium]